MHKLLDVLSSALCEEKCRACNKEIRVDVRDSLFSFNAKTKDPSTLCGECFEKMERESPLTRIVNVADLAPLLVASRIPYEGPLKKILYHLKYDDDRLVVDDLSIFLSQALERLSKLVRIKNCVLVPVPLHWKRMLKRGFNQAELMANRVGQAYDLPVDTHILRRVRSTSTQHQLKKLERKINVEDAFRAHPRLTDGKEIILVDDLLTSGATLASCASALLAEGALSVNAITLAYAVSSAPCEIHDQ